jgi:hypothetical protein
VHPVQVASWKKQALDELPQLFGDRQTKAAQDEETLPAELYRQTGKFKVELDWMKEHWTAPHRVPASALAVSRAPSPRVGPCPRHPTGTGYTIPVQRHQHARVPQKSSGRVHPQKLR